MSEKIRVLVVDDSALMRKLITQVLLRDPSIEVVGTAADGAIGLKKIEELHPHVVTLDLDMPRMDGIEMLRQITRKHRLPVIIVSSYSERSATITLKALSLGAFDFVTKPQEAPSGQLEQIAAELAAKIKVAAATGAPKLIITVPESKQKGPRPFSTGSRWPSRVIGVGISTGGPNALQYLLAQIPADFPACFLIVQHMPEGFTQMFAQRLNESSAIEVKEAQSGDLILAGRALICPGNRHMKVRRMEHGDVAILVDQPRVNGHRPSVDVLFQSLAQEFAAKATGVLMTGMGEDGAAGMGAIQAAGGFTIAQSPETCVVDSMPRSAIQRGFAARVVSLAGIAGALQSDCASETASHARENFVASLPSGGVGRTKR
ncbi:MAG TPA: chemotaxis response regulator protein-glutamate methylesterase [Candidatus Acidoferrales bacterium]|nr:chemotaxis response regulator protein-glutamate methylesterase [Candidatus Acidoferrales bacterium]